MEEMNTNNRAASARGELTNAELARIERWRKHIEKKLEAYRAAPAYGTAIVVAYEDLEAVDGRPIAETILQHMVDDRGLVPGTVLTSKQRLNLECDEYADEYSTRTRNATEACTADSYVTGATSCWTASGCHVEDFSKFIRLFHSPADPHTSRANSRAIEIAFAIVEQVADAISPEDMARIREEARRDGKSVAEILFGHAPELVNDMARVHGRAARLEADVDEIAYGSFEDIREAAAHNGCETVEEFAAKCARRIPARRTKAGKGAR